MGLPTEDNIYGYDASLPAAIVFSVLNSILLGYHSYLSLIHPCCHRHTLRQRHRYTIPLFVAALFATVGYTTRCNSIQHASSVSLYAVSSSYIVLSPIFVCATLYWQLKHLLLLLLPPGPRQRLFGLNPRWLGRIFIASDVTSFLTQGAGSGIASSGNWEGSEKDIGEGVLIGGLTLQLVTFSTYLVFLFRVVRRVQTAPDLGFPRGVKHVLVGVLVASALVQIRTIFRLVEFALGIDGYPFQHEWCLYVFESAPMFLALAALGWWHPVKHLQQGKRCFDDSEVVEGMEKKQHASGGGSGGEDVAIRV